MRVRTRRIHPWLRAALVLYMVSVVLAVAVHQHRDPLRSHDCALCTVAHMPIALPAGPALVAPPARSTGTLSVGHPLEYDSGTPRTHLGRAPPLA